MPEAPAPIPSRSATNTERPCCANRQASESPMIPAPTMATSATRRAVSCMEANILHRRYVASSIQQNDTAAVGAPATLADGLRAVRRSRGLPLANVAAATDISASFLSLVEQGK